MDTDPNILALTSNLLFFSITRTDINTLIGSFE